MDREKPNYSFKTAATSDKVSFDQGRALRYFGGNINLLRTLAKMFTSGRLDLSSSMEKALASHDFSSLAQTAHKLRGTLGFLAADAAFEAATKFEESCHQTNDARAQAAYQSLNRELSRLEIDLNLL